MGRVGLSLSWVCVALLGCTNAGVYAAGEGGPNGPAAAFEGTVCIPLATGDDFPVKVLFAVEAGDGISASVKGAIQGGLSAFVGAQAGGTTVNFSYEMVAFHTVATGIQGAFIQPNDPNTPFSTVMAKLNAYQEVGPVSLRAPLELAESLLSGDMQTGCRGTVGRTRYIVVLIYTDQDVSCVNPSFNLGIDTRCTALLPDVEACGACELERVAAELKSIGETYGAGQLTIQPIYVTGTPVVDGGTDPAAFEGQAIAQAGSTQFIQTDTFAKDVTTAIATINTASLQSAYVLKRFIAFDRNTLARKGETLVDTDGDGLSDDEEIALGTDPNKYDTDGDGLGDGVEVKMGLDPLTPNVLTGCNPFSDADGDRLNDCEEKVLGTNPCMGDTDGDGLPDMVEFLSGTNPLVPEDLRDSDRDGILNADEVIGHTDANAVDTAFAAQSAYRYTINPAPSTVDGRACYAITAENITLGQTLPRPNPPFAPFPAGTNDIYLYFQVGLPNQPHGVGIGSLDVRQVQRLSATRRRPVGTLSFAPSDFVLGF